MRPRSDAAETRAWRRTERRRLIAARLSMDDVAYAQASAAVVAALGARFALADLGRVAGYWPIRREVDCRPFLTDVIAAGGEAALPVVTGPDQPLAFRSWTPETPMAPGAWDILHPAAGDFVRPDTLLIPLVGFDNAGHRLGYGGGYYDRTLAALAAHRPLTIGLGFELGRLASLRPGAHDATLDFIFTEAGLAHGPAGG